MILGSKNRRNAWVVRIHPGPILLFSLFLFTIGCGGSKGPTQPGQKTATPTRTQTALPFSTPSATHSATSTMTLSPTDTLVPTSTSTHTTTSTASSTPTETETTVSTATSTETATLSPTDSITPTPTASPSPTPTATLPSCLATCAAIRDACIEAAFEDPQTIGICNQQYDDCVAACTAMPTATPTLTATPSFTATPLPPVATCQAQATGCADGAFGDPGILETCAQQLTACVGALSATPTATPSFTATLPPPVATCQAQTTACADGAFGDPGILEICAQQLTACIGALSTTPTVTPTQTPSPTASPTPSATGCVPVYAMGNTNIEPSSVLAPGYFFGQAYNLSLPATLTAVVVHLTGDGVTLHAGVYWDNGIGTGPTNLISESSLVPAAASGWTTIGIPPTALSPGLYWLEVQYSGSTGISNTQTNSFFDKYAYLQTTFSPTFPADASGFSRATGRVFSLYALTCAPYATASPTSTATAQTVTIPDPNLEAVLRAVIPKPTGPLLSSDLAGITGQFDAQDSSISDLTGMEYCVNLAYIYLSGNSITDLSPLANLRYVDVLDVSYNSISSVPSLAGMTSLLDFSAMENSITDLSPIAAAPRLRNINLTHNAVGSLAPLAGKTTLAYLSFPDNSITDLSPLAALTGLLSLDVGNSSPSPGNNISDLSPLAGLTGLQSLAAPYNSLSDLSPLSGLTDLQELYLIGNSITDLAALVSNPGIGTGDIVELVSNPLSATAKTVQIPILQGRGVNVSFTP